MKRFQIITGLLVLATAVGASKISADGYPIVVIVNEANSTQVMSAREVRKLFLGKSRKLPNGSRALVVSNNVIITEFNRIALGKADSQVKEAWSRLLFSGRATRPIAFADPADVIKFVKENPNAVGYVLAPQLQEGVKTVYTLKKN